ncbi:APC family permease [Aquisalibacillus elongatus]|uniref:Amino acid/polyamine/organocation transporter (APC superfamily) n=1 Tax=Aquisalibacillus elongatus TaxID=485577 RepID=A0A3N5BDU1_9BACI|nr:APC family permease [Aquisalibacillus elongatus]RPF53480.1 amino acid/polyamine/organocation transporter (APC superfamily) [Aquisalibacillus elongatus]
MSQYKKNSITLIGAIGLGTGVMISAGIFALLGQVAELGGKWFPFIFILGGIVTAFSSYSYIKLSNSYPSAGGIGMYLVKEYGKGTLTAFAALLMAFSMVINQSLVARTFGTYSLQLFDMDESSLWVPVLGVILLIFAFIVNISGNKFIQSFTSFVSLLKIIGLLIFAGAGLLVTNFALSPAESTGQSPETSIASFIAAIALTVLSFKGFTTITNQGEEIVKPKKNVGRAITFSILISLIVYILLAWAVSSNLPLNEIIQKKDYALAAASEPALGNLGVWFTVIIAIIATISGIIASVFAVSRMLAMLTKMDLIPHSHFGMPGKIQRHTLVYTIVIAMILTVLFDLSRIASMGAILYLVMDMIIHWGLLTKLKQKVDFNRFIVIGALILDGLILLAFLWVKIKTDILIVIISIIIMVLTYLGERWFLKLSQS